MKHFKQLFIYSLLTIMVTGSCQKENIPSSPQTITWPEGASDYAPYTIGSTFTYVLTSYIPTLVTDNFTLTVTKDTLIGNLRFYKLESDKPSVSPSYFVNSNNGDLREVTYGLGFLGLITIDKLDEVTLKENALVNSTWSDPDKIVPWDNGTYTIPVTIKFGYTLLQRDFIKKICDKNYSSAIEVKEIVNVSLPAGIDYPQNAPSQLIYDNIYSKDAGLILWWAVQDSDL